MASDRNGSTEISLAQQGQEKFDFYLLSLVFTLLALAVQTAAFGSNHVRNAIELSGWLLFLASGLSGLYRLQWVPVLRSVLASQNTFESEVYQLKELQLKGQTEVWVLDTQTAQPIPERIANRTEGAKKLAARVAQLEGRIQIAYEAHKYAFIFGLLAVALSRAYEPAVAIFQHLRGQ